MKPLRCLILLASIAMAVVCQARTLHVATWGDDSRNAGQTQNKSTPWRTISRAVRDARGGDTILVAAGTYSENVFIDRGGYPGGELILRSEEREGAKVRGWIHAVNQNYITVENFDVVNSASKAPTKGISFVGGHHLTVRGCKVHRCFGGGIAFDQCDWILCEWNTAFANAYYDPGQHSGISVYQPRYNGNDSRKYGIIIRNNRCEANYNVVPNPRFGRGTDGNGIVLDDFRGRQRGGSNYDRMTLVENNVCVRNGGNGIHCFQSQNIRIRNNTCVGNCIAFALGGDVSLSDADRVYVYNNIISTRGGRFSVHQINSTGFGVWNNLIVGQNFAAYDIGTIWADPKFDPGTYRPSFESPAIDAGMDAGDHYGLDIEGKYRFKGTIDIGAHEF